jgi:hypothetical protein
MTSLRWMSLPATCWWPLLSTGGHVRVPVGRPAPARRTG